MQNDKTLSHNSNSIPCATIVVTTLMYRMRFLNKKNKTTTEQNQTPATRPSESCLNLHVERNCYSWTLQQENYTTSQKQVLTSQQTSLIFVIHTGAKLYGYNTQYLLKTCIWEKKRLGWSFVNVKIVKNERNFQKNRTNQLALWIS